MSENFLEGKVAIITGASSGIGAALAKMLASYGVKVALAARRLDRLEEVKKEIENGKGSKRAIAKVCDVTKRDDLKELVAITEKELGHVDILINNAGVMPLTYVKNLRQDDWDNMIDVNVKGVLNGVAAVLPSMMSRKKGDIVNVSSDAGRKVFIPGVVYCASKWAVEAFTQGLRTEMSSYGIRVLSVQPGATKTELVSTTKDPEALENMKNFGTGMRFLEAEDVARAARFLLYILFTYFEILNALNSPPTVSINEILIRSIDQPN